MIIDNIKNAFLYYGISKKIETALKFLLNNDFSKMEPGKHEINGEEIYMMVSNYDTKTIDQGIWEAHRKYIDIQYVFEGSEYIGYANINSLKVTREYDEKGDYLLLEGKGDLLKVEKGTFMVLFPEDAHMPCIAVDRPGKVKKIVIKVKV
ncbi:MAG: YhcH/YjgK/YiaL family protein [Firmicutes bacterium]|nr:YhcH/YjgK/YiaL family protein [Bacillota bacterium]